VAVIDQLNHIVTQAVLGWQEGDLHHSLLLTIKEGS